LRLANNSQTRWKKKGKTSNLKEGEEGYLAKNSAMKPSDTPKNQKARKRKGAYSNFRGASQRPGKSSVIGASGRKRKRNTGEK